MTKKDIAEPLKAQDHQSSSSLASCSAPPLRMHGIYVNSYKTDHMITRAHSISRVRNDKKDKLRRYYAPHTVPGT